MGLPFFVDYRKFQSLLIFKGMGLLQKKLKFFQNFYSHPLD